MTDKFHNPYHFVPVTNDPRKDTWQPRDVFIDGSNDLGHWSHKRYVDKDRDNKPVHHGRIVCRLTTKTPIFIGAKRTRDGSDDAPGAVAPFELDGKPAIPATSLRGMISSIAEAASNSALRVLEDKTISHRASMPGLSAIGMIICDTDSEGKVHYRLKPLSLPTLVNNNKNGYSLPNDSYRKMFVENNNTPRLKVLIGWHPTCPEKLGSDNKVFLKSYTQSHPEFYYMNLKNDWKFDKDLSIAYDHLIRNPTNRKGPGYDRAFCLGQRPCKNSDVIIPEDQATSDQKRDWTRGILRVLDVPVGSPRELPPMRRHEVFIPYPAGAEKWNTYPVPPEVVDTFHRIADERTDADKSHDLPFEPYGTLRNTSKKKHGEYFRLKEGDLVYFMPDDSGESIAVISLSAIWRSGPRFNNRLASIYDFFRNINSEFLPFNNNRKEVSPVEMIFGLVEDRKKFGESVVAPERDQALAFAGRVRFSHGIFQTQPGKEEVDPYLQEVTLKILDTPKPPSPALYFSVKDGAPKHISKGNLDVGKHRPQGRKFYLHKYAHDEQPWKTIITSGKNARFKQKVAITPLRKEQTFWFHIDFDNLNEYELGMLLYALQPDAKFHHKIGMGKPLGLGSVKIEPIALHFIDRIKRYSISDIYNKPRYSQSLLFQPELWKNRPLQYAKEEPGDKIWLSYTDTRSIFEKTINQEVKYALEAIGNPDNVKHRVHNPLQESQSGENAEIDSFRWFVRNDNRKNPDKQCLKPIKKPDDKDGFSSGELPFLYRNEGR